MMGRHTGDVYTEEFKREAVKLVTEQGLSRAQVARDLGISADTVARWVQDRAPQPAAAPVEAPGPSAAELARIRRENEQLRMERDILKKRSASSRSCPNERQLPVRGQPREPVPGGTHLPGAGGGPQRIYE
jgi:transposase